MTVRAFLRIIHINQFRTVQSCSRVQCFEIPWTAAHQAPLSIEFSGQEYWSGLSFSSPFLWIVYRCYPFPLGPVQVLVFWGKPTSVRPLSDLPGVTRCEDEESHSSNRVPPHGNPSHTGAGTRALCLLPHFLPAHSCGEPAHSPGHPHFLQPPHPHVFLPGQPVSV